MRFLRMLLIYLVVGGGLLFAGVMIVMYVISFSQTVSLSQAISSAKRLSRNPGHFQDCMVDVNMEEYPLKGYQVRFENNKDYVVEAVCLSPARGPFEVSRNKLLFGVTKEQGFSGVLFSPTYTDLVEAKIVIKLGYAKWIVDAGKKARVAVTPTWWSSDLPTPGDQSAVATCEGWGYQCCNDLTQVGMGETVKTNIASCNDSCFTKCFERPSILIFTSEPELNPINRELILRKNDGSVVFSYSVQDVDSSGVVVSIDYGDGQNATSTNETDQFSHTYACKQFECLYIARLTVTDNEGLENSRTRISEITVKIR